MSRGNGRAELTAPVLIDAPAGGPDIPRAEAAVAELMDALGLDRDGEAMRDTPRRVAAAYAELLTPEPFRATTFPNDGGYDELVVVRTSRSPRSASTTCCRSSGSRTSATCPATGSWASRSSPAWSSTARAAAGAGAADGRDRRLARAELRPKGVGVVLEATTLCMSLRGVRQPGAVTTTSALRGRLRDDPRTRQEFLELIGRARA